MEYLNNCPVCSNETFRDAIVCQDYTVSQQKFQIVSCTNCKLEFTNPRPAPGEIAQYYESENYISHSNTNKGIINKLYHLVKKRSIRNKINLINDLKPRNKILLDIGSGTGSFLGQIKTENWNVKGIEPSLKARQISTKDFSLDVFAEEEINNFKKESFCIITMWHVLEHVHFLKKRIQEIYDLLEPNGHVIIAVPNYTSWDANHYKEFWAGYDVPRHLYHFSPEVIKLAFKEVNLLHIKSLPMRMDSYYVSMLSEKYKKTNLGLLKAFIAGLKSNLNAKNNAEKYSSVIYIFQKK